jgi:hypothetical protein
VQISGAGSIDVWTNPFLDMALMLVELPVHDETKEYLPMGMMALSPGIPDIGQPCIGLGYTSVNWEVRKGGTARNLAKLQRHARHVGTNSFPSERSAPALSVFPN